MTVLTRNDSLLPSSQHNMDDTAERTHAASKRRRWISSGAWMAVMHACIAGQGPLEVRGQPRRSCFGGLDHAISGDVWGSETARCVAK